MNCSHNKFLAFCLVAFLCFLCVGCQINSKQHNVVDEFDASEAYYQLRMEQYSDSMLVNPISNMEIAKQEALEIFQLAFDIEQSDYGPCTVAFDSGNRIWLIWTKPAPQESGGIVFGGAKCVLIRSNGQVLAIWEEK